MSIRLCVCGLDGVIADATKRFERAELAKALYLSGTDRPEMLQKEAANIFWREVFNPANAEMDVLIEGSDEAIAALEAQGYQIVYLTSRPESMRVATLDWLYSIDLSGPKLIMKPPAFQFTKTTLWKAGTIQMLVAMYGADAVLIVDDEDSNLIELMKYDTAEWRLCSSLGEAVGKAT
jgi:hypothetical protein